MKDRISRLRQLLRSQTLTESEVHDLAKVLRFADACQAYLLREGDDPTKHLVTAYDLLDGDEP